MGLCKPADYIATENTKNSTHGVLPYITPEILREQNYTKADDIYSFGIIMYEVFSGLLLIMICRSIKSPTASEIKTILVQWNGKTYTNEETELRSKLNLPELKNSDDYYDNIISTKYSENLQIDISQLKINENDQNNESKDKENF
ncbi:hypothetical protein C1645_833309 [Glomus cerebriforme]|uniref:Protein kinase domain-containing protein n=1 Tax=Glomus cerebriforme TaxID=658196 RepID=A0A397SCQ6_9GLOM|nr:hypothetical protein C1645_833309 [Glomus cerebriforme]